MQKFSSKNINDSYRPHLREPTKDSLPLVALAVGAFLIVFTSLFSMDLLLQIVWQDTPIIVL